MVSTITEVQMGLYMKTGRVIQPICVCVHVHACAHRCGHACVGSGGFEEGTLWEVMSKLRLDKEEG